MQEEQQSATRTSVEASRWALISMSIAARSIEEHGQSISGTMHEFGYLHEYAKGAIVAVMLRDLALSGIPQEDVRFMVKTIYESAEAALGLGR